MQTKRGISLIEAIISISIIVGGLTGVMILLSRTISSSNINENRLIALNLAREGIEAVRYIRDTNWLNYSNNRRMCWNYAPEDPLNCTEDGATGMNTHRLQGNYIVNLDTANFTWDITTDNTAQLDETNHLYLKDGFYQHDSMGEFTIFYRQIQISYPDGTSGVPANKNEDNKMLVKSIVRWGGSGQTIVLETVLTDFLDRKIDSE